MTAAPVVLFVCIHDAGRPQMAAGYMRALSGGAVEVSSGGSEPGDLINPIAVQAMAEEGIAISQAVPQLMSTEDVRESDAVITMGCGDVCPIHMTHLSATANAGGAYGNPRFCALWRCCQFSRSPAQVFKIVCTLCELPGGRPVFGLLVMCSEMSRV